MSPLDRSRLTPALHTTLALLLAVAAPLRAADAQGGDSVPQFKLNGYFTQAAALSRGGLVEGIPSDGTINYHRAAVVARVFPTLNDRFVAQVSHRAKGDSPTKDVQRETQLAWAFYERSFGSATQVRLGRAPIPMGIHNETRNVGTLLPFYEPPSSVYQNHQFSNEHIDGVVAIHELFGQSAMPVEVAVYGGSMDYTEAFQLPAAPSAERPQGGWDYRVSRARARDLLGAHTWISTPLTGLRVGGGVVRTTMTGGLREEGQSNRVTVWSASVDGTFERFTARAEMLGGDLEWARGRMGYVQVGRTFGPVTINAQTEHTRLLLRNMPVPPTFAPQTFSMPSQNHALSIAWSIRSALQLKLEGHRTRGYNLEEGFDLTGPPRRGGYSIVALSMAF